MFALSFGKLLVLAVVLFGVWTVWRRVDRQPPAARGPAARDPAAPSPVSGDAVELIRCPVCSVFISRHNQRRCDRSDCPAI